MRGGTITLNLYDPDGHLLDYRRVEELASLERISLRTGCFCNPGAGESPRGSPTKTCGPDLRWARHHAEPFPGGMQRRDGKSIGAIRASLGLVSNFADV